jgi:glycosyltransferase involved in cell wall biosynthesis
LSKGEVSLKRIKANNKPNQVLYINPVAQIGGAERSLMLLIRGINRNLFTPIVVSLSEGPLQDAIKECGSVCHYIKLSEKVTKLSRLYGKYSLLDYLQGLGGAFSCILSLASFIRGQRINIVHTNGIKAHFLGGLAAKLSGVPIIWHLRDFIPPGIEKDILMRIASIVPDKIIVNSDAVGEQFSGTPGAYRKVVRIYNAVDFEEFRPSVQGGHIREEFKIDNSVPLVGIIAHLTPWKGHDYFLKAAVKIAEEIPDVMFMIVGDVIYQTEGHRKYKEVLEKLCSDLGLQDRVIFTGFRNDIPEIISTLDLVVHASSQPEPFGRILIEAMAMGKPLVATNLGGVPEIVKNGYTGLLVPPKEPAAIAEASIKILKNRQLALKLGNNGLEHARLNFDVISHVEQIEKLYYNVLNGH